MKSTLAENELPIVYDPVTRKYTQVNLDKAVSQWIAATEGSYIVLENPAQHENESHPKAGQVNGLAAIHFGRKINIPGPRTFPLWPGQSAKVIEGHRLRTNQYLLVRVYNDEEAQKNAASAVIRRVEPAISPQTSQQQNNPDDTQDTGSESQEPQQHSQTQLAPTTETTKFTMGKLLVIKGNEVSFYIPPTGIEVVQDDNGQYVREAATLERLEYCVLLSENGNKRYVKGPDVVFPEPTETFIDATNGSRKLKAIELNDDMGIYIKVTADYTEGDRNFTAGEELFITGREQRLYYPRAEHSIIKYGDREIYYGVAIPEGEARYVLDKQTGKVETVRGPQIFLPDPRRQVVVRRVLTESEVTLWYPGNKRASDHNDRLREMQKQYGDVVTDESVRMFSNVPGRRATRSVSSESSVEAFSGNTFDRGTSYTPPRTITLDTKFDGAVAINIWKGYAVLVVDKAGNQRVEVGPKTVLLEYDETLQILHLSTGKPKTTDKLEDTVYLRVSFNQVSDVVDVVTKDMVTASIKLSHRVNFVGEDPAKWFSVENYVKFMCDHARSLLRNAAKQCPIEELNADYINIVRDTILGASGEGGRKGRLFEENGVLIYDVEVSNLTIGDAEIGKMLNDMQQAAVHETLQVATRERELEATKRIEAINREIADQKEETAAHLHEQETAGFERTKETLEGEAQVQAAKESAKDEANNRQMARDQAAADQKHQTEVKTQELKTTFMNAEVEAIVKKAGAISPQLIAALQSFGDTKIASDLATALSPLAILGGESVADVMSKILKGTSIVDMALGALAAKNTAAAVSRALSGGTAASISGPGNGPIAG